jgi:2-dehydro-3-deoxyglucarate aldolase/4-hydroxy-2-oxoheptanedioate aldolase
MRENTVKRTLTEGGTSVGTMVFEFGTTGLARILAMAGADFALFDQEHNGWGVERLKVVIATARATDVVPFVRVAGSSYSQLTQPLDVGAMGIVVPMVETEAQAKEIIASVKHPPIGRRGVGILFRDEYHQHGLGATLAARNDETLIAVQIETAAGLEEVEAIAAVDGIDCLWIGYHDLSTSLGVPGDYEHPAYREAIDRVRNAALVNGKVLGRVATDVGEAKKLLNDEVRLLAYGSDIGLYELALRAGLADVRTEIAAATST